MDMNGKKKSKLMKVCVDQTKSSLNHKRILEKNMKRTKKNVKLTHDNSMAIIFLFLILQSIS